MGRISKMDIHPDRHEVLELLKQGLSHKNIVAKINARYPQGDELRISTAAISRYINKDKTKPIELPVSIENDIKELQQAKQEQQKKTPEPKKTIGSKVIMAQKESKRKATELSDALHEFAMSETVQNNLISLIELLPSYVAEGREAKELKALAESTKVYFELLNSVKKVEDPTSNTELTYDDIKAAEAGFEDYD